MYHLYTNQTCSNKYYKLCSSLSFVSVLAKIADYTQDHCDVDNLPAARFKVYLNDETAPIFEHSTFEGVINNARN